METQFVMTPERKRLSNAAVVVLVLLSIFLLAQTLNILSGDSDDFAEATITVSGEGEVVVIPDVAEVSFTVREEALIAGDAQDAAATAVNNILDALDELGIDEDDTKTTNYSLYPKYEWKQEKIACVTYPCPQPPGENVLVGYEVSQTIRVTIEDVDNAGEVLSALGNQEADTVSGLSLTVSDEDELLNEARDIAIEDAQEQAKDLAKALGVRLVKVVGFNEHGSGYPYPFYETRSDFAEFGYGGSDEVIIPDIPVGESIITAEVSITYEIR